MTKTFDMDSLQNSKKFEYTPELYVSVSTLILRQSQSLVYMYVRHQELFVFGIAITQNLHHYFKISRLSVLGCMCHPVCQSHFIILLCPQLQCPHKTITTARISRRSQNFQFELNLTMVPLFKRLKMLQLLSTLLFNNIAEPWREKNQGSMLQLFQNRTSRI